MKKIFCFFVSGLMLTGSVFAVDAIDATTPAATGATNVETYDAEGSIFQKIADLEQDKVLMQLEKEKAQLQLDLDRISAEQTRLIREQDEANARAEEQKAEIEQQRQALLDEKQKLDEQKKQMQEQAMQKPENTSIGIAGAPDKQTAKESQQSSVSITDKYFLREIVGAGNQLFATVENLSNGKQTKVSVGKSLDGYLVKSISLDDGLEFEKNGETIVLSVGMGDAKGNE